ncbi:MAG: polyribonucleotide nucleotidyltransferase, partial [Clostridia bacterium]|nr:polyribonucleotide nucleotidyltransferase [Clostridia bacterium]
MEKNYVFETTVGGRKLVVETGKYTEQANGTCWVRCGETVVQASVTMADSPRDGIDFFPLGVDFEEKMYAVGKIPGGFKKREGRPSDKAILTSRLIDRPLRPLFPKGFYNDVAVVCTALSVDPDIAPEPLAMLASSVALSISDIPFAGPTGSVVVGCIDDEFIINPNLEQKEKSEMHVTVSGTDEAILMVEAGAKEVTEQKMLDAIMFAHEEIKKLIKFQNDIVKQIGKEKRTDLPIFAAEEEINKAVREFADEKLDYALDTFDRQVRQQRQDELNEEVFAHFAEIFPDKQKMIADVMYKMTKEKVRAKILNNGVRPDGRKLKEIRPIW